MRRVIPSLALLSACVRTVGPGPDVGDCAVYPEGTWTFGEIGIGTCLAGPTDVLVFTGNDGVERVAVANADPYLTFTGGSVLVFRTDGIDATVAEQTLADVGAVAIPADRFVAGLGYVGSRSLLLAAGRHSPDAQTTSARDDVEVFDLTVPTAPVPWPAGGVTVEDDPVYVRIDEASGHAYVVNVTDHSVTVLDTTGTPLQAVDVALDATIGSATPTFAPDPSFGEAPGGGVFQVDASTITDDTLVPTDAWTMTWVDGTWRVWTPSSVGLQRWSSGGGDYVASDLGLEIVPDQLADVSEARDPFVGSVSGALAMYFSDEGDLKSLLWDESIDDWSGDSLSIELSGRASAWNAWIGGATVLAVNGDKTVFYEGRETANGAAAIGRSGRENDFSNRGDPVLTAPVGADGIGQPYVVHDDITGNLRLWATVYAASGPYIGVAASADDGLTWGEVTPVQGLGAAAAPVVAWANGRFLLWASVPAGEGAAVVQGWSFDGVNWRDVHPVLDLPEAWSDVHPPRAAVQASVEGGFRLEGADAGRIQGVLQVDAEDAVVAGKGFSLRVTAGAEIADDGVFAPNGVEPGGFASVDGEDVLFATAWDAELRPRIVALVAGEDGWDVLDDDVVPEGVGGNEVGARSPVIQAEDGGFTLYYAAAHADGVTRVHRATSPDGQVWDAEPEPLFDSLDPWDSVEQLPHAIEPTEDGGARLWYGGSNGARYRIGAAVGVGGVFTAEVGLDDPWQIDAGHPGDFDDSGVKDPLLVDEDGVRALYYAGFDGEAWHVGRAAYDGARWVRREDADGVGVPALAAMPSLFSAGGAYAPVAGPDGRVWYAGTDGVRAHVGRALPGVTQGPDGEVGVLFPEPRFPSAGDSLSFTTRRGDAGPSVISLAQTVDGVTASGVGLAGAWFDDARGFLYVTTKMSPYVYVVDVRDDSSGDFVDRNAFDVEALLVFSTENGPRGFRDAQPVGDRLYLTSYAPDALWVVDLSVVEDDDQKQVIYDGAIGVLPLALSTEDEGEPSFTGTRGVRLGAGDMALDSAGTHLWVPQYADNSVAVFDLRLGAFGAPIATVRGVGEGPHQVRLTGQDRYAIVANYIGEVDENVVSPTLTVVDADPNSPTFLSIVTRMGNQP